MDRKQFEEWFKTTLSYAIFEDSNVWKVDLYAFNGPTNSYLHSGVQSSFESWQHLQAKVEELQTHAQEIHKREIKLFEKTLILTHERDGLQKRVTRANEQLNGFIRMVDEDLICDESLARLIISNLKGLEQALKG